MIIVGDVMTIITDTTKREIARSVAKQESKKVCISTIRLI
jgi:hypothetical protein